MPRIVLLFRFSLRHCLLFATVASVAIGLHFSTVGGMSRVTNNVETACKEELSDDSSLDVFIEAEYVFPGVVHLEVSYGGYHGYSRYYIDLFGVVLILPKSRRWIS